MATWDLGKVVGADGKSATLEITGVQNLPYGSDPVITEEVDSTPLARKYRLGIPAGKPGTNAGGGGAGIDDGSVATDTTYSSVKIEAIANQLSQQMANNYLTKVTIGNQLSKSTNWDDVPLGTSYFNTWAGSGGSNYPRGGAGVMLCLGSADGNIKIQHCITNKWNATRFFSVSWSGWEYSSPEPKNVVVESQTISSSGFLQIPDFDSLNHVLLPGIDTSGQGYALIPITNQGYRVVELSDAGVSVVVNKTISYEYCYI